MKKLLFSLLTIIAVSCGSKDETTPQSITSYQIKVEYSPAKEVQKRLSYDAQLKETLYMHEYNSNGIEIDSKLWSNPNIGQENIFNASKDATCVAIQIEVIGTARDGSAIAMSQFVTQPLRLEIGKTVSMVFSASTPMSDANPMLK